MSSIDVQEAHTGESGVFKDKRGHRYRLEHGKRVSLGPETQQPVSQPASAPSQPIIGSLLDSDFYKFTMGQLVFHRFPNAQVSYKFTNRGKTEFPAGFADALNQQIQHLSNVGLSAAEKEWLVKQPGMKPDYVDFLSSYRFKPEQVQVTQNGGKMDLEVHGPWAETILWEVPLMAMISELYYKMVGKGRDQQEAVGKMSDKAEKLSAAGVHWIDFGSRRRFSYENQDDLNGAMKGTPGFMGTSNPHLAMKHGLTPVGTFAHEAVMGMQGKVGFQNANKEWMHHWLDEYKGQLGIVLTDTLTTAAFLKDFNKDLADQFAGVRQDSGDPAVFGEKIIQHYKDLGIDPKTKTIVFSDSLDPDLAIALHKQFSGRVKTLFGIGTNLSNDVGHQPLSIVVKLKDIDFGDGPKDVVKLSDVSGKESGTAEAVALAKKSLGIPLHESIDLRRSGFNRIAVARLLAPKIRAAKNPSAWLASFTANLREAGFTGIDDNGHKWVNGQQVKRVIVMGMAADPVHKGHVAMAKHVRDNMPGSEVWMMPANEHALGKRMASPQHRLEMVQKAIADEPGLVTSDFEIRHGMHGYAIDRHEALQQEYPDYEFYNAIGADNANDFNKWHRHEELADKFPFVVSHRAGVPLTAEAERFKHGHHKILPVSDEIPEVSSTKIKQMLQTGDPDVQNYLHPDVYRHIQQHGLYGQPHAEVIESVDGSMWTVELFEHGFTGIDSHGHKWQDGRQVHRYNDEPAQRKPAVTALPQKKTAVKKSPRPMDGLFTALSKADGGFTYQPETGDSPEKGFALSIHTDRSFGKAAKDLTEDDLTDYVIKNQDLFAQPDNYMGAWHDPATGQVYLDVSMVVQDAAKAHALSLQHDQIAYFDLAKKQSVSVNPHATSGGVVKGEEAELQKAGFGRNWKIADSEGAPSFMADVHNLLNTGKASLKIVSVDDITSKIGEKEKVNKYANAFKSGAKFPVPVGFVRADGKIDLPDGNHRAEGWKAVGHKNIPIVVIDWDKLHAKGEEHGKSAATSAAQAADNGGKDRGAVPQADGQGTDTGGGAANQRQAGQGPAAPALEHLPANPQELAAKADEISGHFHAAAVKLLAKFPRPDKWLKSKTEQVKTKLTARYGVKGATAILAAGQVITWGITIGAPALTGLPIFVPPGGGIATSLALAGLVEVYRKVKGMGNPKTATTEAAEPHYEELSHEDVWKHAAEMVNELIAGVHHEMDAELHESAEVANAPISVVELAAPKKRREVVIHERFPDGSIKRAEIVDR